MPKSFGVADVLASRKPPKHGLPQHPDQRITAVPAGASVGENPACRYTEAALAVAFPVCEQTGASRTEAGKIGGVVIDDAKVGR